MKGLLFTVQKALPLLPDGASIILNASIVASKGLGANSVYSASNVRQSRAQAYSSLAGWAFPFVERTHLGRVSRNFLRPIGSLRIR